MISKLRYIFGLSSLILLIGCSGSGGESNDRPVGSVEQTNTEIASQNLPITNIPSGRLFNKSNSSSPSVSFSLDSIEVAAKVDGGSVVLAVGSPMKVSVRFNGFSTSGTSQNSGLAVRMNVANYSAEQFISNTLPEQNALSPIGTWKEVVGSAEGVVDALCRAVNGDFGEPAYNCMSTFVVQGFAGINGSFAALGASQLHLLIEVVGEESVAEIGLSATGLTDSDPVSYITSLPIVLR